MRYVSLLKEKGAYLILECKKELKGLFENVKFIDKIIEKDETKEIEYDYYTHIMSLPNIFDTNLSNIPKNIKLKAKKELIEKFNTYDFSGSKLAKVGGTALICATFGGYYFGKRRFIPPGYFGHYKSSGRHMLTPPGIHIITSVAEQWEKPIPIDPEQDGSRLIRTYGDKTILQVPENHIAGGYKIGVS